MGNTYNVSNAWLKCYELLSYYNIIPNEVKESYVHFGNAEFPGSFICASHHYIATKTNWLNKYIWKGSSLVEINELNEQPLADEYALWKNYTDNWLMNKIHSGDVLNKDNQHYFHVDSLLQSSDIKLPIQVYLPPNNKVNDAIVNKFPNAKKYALPDPWNNPLAFIYKIYD